jgi:hypothetical protein
VAFHQPQGFSRRRPKPHAVDRMPIITQLCAGLPTPHARPTADFQFPAFGVQPRRGKPSTPSRAEQLLNAIAQGRQVVNHHLPDRRCCARVSRPRTPAMTAGLQSAPAAGMAGKAHPRYT